MKHLDKYLENWDFRSSILPDFGFDVQNLKSQDQSGWQLVLEYVQQRYKYERLENYVEARVLLLKQIEKLKKAQEMLRTKNSKTKEIVLVKSNFKYSDKFTEDLKILKEI